MAFVLPKPLQSMDLVFPGSCEAWHHQSSEAYCVPRFYQTQRLEAFRAIPHSTTESLLSSSGSACLSYEALFGGRFSAPLSRAWRGRSDGGELAVRGRMSRLIIKRLTS